MQVSQGGAPERQPSVLVRFRDVIGYGNVTGPYRGYLYYWKTADPDAIDEVAAAMWPYLSTEKRNQFAVARSQASRGQFIEPPAIRSATTELAWAAGLFDGEGSISSRSNARGREWLELELPQSSVRDVPETLSRFHAVVGVGAITGPRVPRNAWSRLPQYRWRIAAQSGVAHVLVELWPHLGQVTRARTLAVRHLLGPEAASKLVDRT
jgi:hypothetical protein